MHICLDPQDFKRAIKHEHYTLFTVEVEVKSLTTNAPTLKFYDINKRLTLSVGASSERMDALLIQDHRAVAYGSRALTDCHFRYAQIEKELLAIVYGCEMFHQYVYSREVQVESDHKPLESILKKKRYIKHH